VNIEFLVANLRDRDHLEGIERRWGNDIKLDLEELRWGLGLD